MTTLGDILRLPMVGCPSCDRECEGTDYYLVNGSIKVLCLGCLADKRLAGLTVEHVEF